MNTPGKSARTLTTGQISWALSENYEIRSVDFAGETVSGFCYQAVSADGQRGLVYELVMDPANLDSRRFFVTALDGRVIDQGFTL